MRQSVWRLIVFALALALVCSGLWLLLTAHSAEEDLQAPMLPDDQPTILMSATPSSSASPSSPSKSSTSVTPEPIQDPRGNPTRVVIRSAKTGKRIIDTTLVPVYLQADRRLVPPGGTGGWYAEKGWPKPGVETPEARSIIVGHVSGGGKPDVFYDLPRVRKGDTAVVTFDTLDKVVIEITMNPKSVGKDDVTQDPKYNWVWYSKKKGRTVSFFTCDIDAPHVNGFSVNNIITQGKVVKVIHNKK